MAFWEVSLQRGFEKKIASFSGLYFTTVYFDF